MCGFSERGMKRERMHRQPPPGKDPPSGKGLPPKGVCLAKRTPNTRTTLPDEPQPDGAQRTPLPHAMGWRTALEENFPSMGRVFFMA